MSLYNEFLEEEFGELSEALIVLGKKQYPKFGHVVIMAGGAGSGKGFVKDKLLGVEGYVSDVDVLKTMAAKTPAIRKRVLDELGVDLKDLAANLKTPENVSKLHEIIGMYLGTDKKKMNALFASVLSAAPDRKPNIIFDMTLQSMDRFERVTRQARELGYDPKNIHIVWVVNDIEIAIEQNRDRDRVVPQEILINTHRGVSATMNDIIAMGKGLRKYMDGDIVLAFNKVKVDSDVKISKLKPAPGKKTGGMYIEKANYFFIKRSGKQVMSLDQIDKEIKGKIASYVPKGVTWD